MKKMVIGLTILMAMVAGVATFATAINDIRDGQSALSHEGVRTGLSNAGSNHEGKPCHVIYVSGARCSCRSCYGNNWGNYYCTRCGHDVKCHY